MTYRLLQEDYDDSSNRQGGDIGDEINDCWDMLNFCRDSYNHLYLLQVR